MSAEIALVVGVAENGVIGAKGALPWRIKADLRRFRADTMGKPMVMGRKTFQSIGRVLDGRDNIVVTRQPGYARPGIIVAKSLDEALSVAETCAQARGSNEICVIGGGEVFRETFPLATRLYVTHVSGKPAGDVFFPDILPDEWEELSREKLPSSEGDTATAEHVVYERRT